MKPRAPRLLKFSKHFIDLRRCHGSQITQYFSNEPMGSALEIIYDLGAQGLEKLILCNEALLHRSDPETSDVMLAVSFLVGHRTPKNSDPR